MCTHLGNQVDFPFSGGALFAFLKILLVKEEECYTLMWLCSIFFTFKPTSCYTEDSHFLSRALFTRKSLKKSGKTDPTHLYSNSSAKFAWKRFLYDSLLTRQSCTHWSLFEKTLLHLKLRIFIVSHALTFTESLIPFSINLSEYCLLIVPQLLRLLWA